MSQPYTSLLDSAPSTPLPLTDRTAKYVRHTVQQISGEIEKLAESETYHLREAAAVKAVREMLQGTRDRYQRDLGPHAAPEVEQPVWPVQPEERSNTAETCPKCGHPMFLTAQYGHVHEIDGQWVAGGEWCVQAAPTDGTQVLPAISDTES